jgi:hypothetical protein
VRAAIREQLCGQLGEGIAGLPERVSSQFAFVEYAIRK